MKFVKLCYRLRHGDFDYFMENYEKMTSTLKAIAYQGAIRFENIELLRKLLKDSVNVHGTNFGYIKNPKIRELLWTCPAVRLDELRRLSHYKAWLITDTEIDYWLLIIKMINSKDFEGLDFYRWLSNKHKWMYIHWLNKKISDISMGLKNSPFDPFVIEHIIKLTYNVGDTSSWDLQSIITPIKRN